MEQGRVRSRASVGLAGPMLAGGFVLLVVLSPCHAQVNGRVGPSSVYADISNAADQLLRTAASHVQAKQWSEALDLYQRVVQQFGETVAPVPKDDPAASPENLPLFIDVREFCQRRIAAMPPEARELYRRRVDAQAERWYRRGLDGRDRASLRRVIDEVFCSSWGDEALEALGDLSFQDGRFGEALDAYRRLVPDASQGAASLVHPDPSVDMARVEAKKLLCRAALGDRPPSAEDIKAFAAAHADAKGSLAGRTGTYADILATALADDRLALPAPLDARWPTFAGSPRRSRVLGEEIDVGSPHWTVKLDRVGSSRGGGMTNIRNQMTQVATEPIAAYHPIVLGDQVIVADDRTVRAYDLDEHPKDADDVLWQYPPQGPAFTAPTARPIAPRASRYSLTAAGDRIFARLMPNGQTQQGGSTSIVALERSKEGKFLWKVQATDLDLPKRANNAGGKSGIAFEAAPVADLRNVYVAISEPGPRVTTWVACLNADTGRPRWVRYVCDAPSTVADNNFNGMGGMNPMIMPTISDAGLRMLTLDGGSLYFQTNLGAVACLDSETGQVRWLATYPRADRLPNTPFDRDLSPAIVHDGVVYVAPTDSQHITAFEAGSGRFLWKSSEPLPKVEHILGVAKGRLIATGDRVWSIDIRNGKILVAWPDNQNGFTGAGRGLLAGDHIYWPTKTEIHVLDQATGTRALHRPPVQLFQKFQQVGGNLVAGDGYLIVASVEGVAVYSQNSRLIQRYREQIVRQPDQAAPYFNLAQIAEATGEDQMALENLAACLERAKSTDLVDTRPMAEVAMARRFDLLMKLGTRAARAADWATAAARFVEAADGGSITARDRLTARLRLADAQVELARIDEAVATLQNLLLDESARTLTVPIDDHQTVRADLRIADRLAAIVKGHGRKVYEKYDEAARDLLTRGVRDGDARLLDQVAQGYPAAECVPDALLALGRLELRENRPARAAKALRRLLNEPLVDATRAAALLDLGRAYEAQKLWSSARDAYEQVLGRFPGVIVKSADGDAAAADLVAARLGQGPLASLMSVGPRTNLPVPLIADGGTSWDSVQRLLIAEGDPPSSDIGRVFLARGSVVRAVHPRTGAQPWLIEELKGEPKWASFLADRLLIATPEQVVAIDVARGTRLWTFDAGPVDAKGVAEPFAKDAGRKRPEPRNLDGFQIAGDRLICQRGERELVAIEGESGIPAWSFSPVAGQIHPKVSAGPQRVVLQTLRPNTLTVLDTSDGRRVLELADAADGEPWPRAPLLLDDDQALIAVGPQTVRLVDLRRGTEAWRFTIDSPLPRNGQPRLIGEGDALLVLFGGNELVRLDGKTGRKIWARILGPEEIGDRPSSLVIDGGRAYFADGPSLGCIALEDGEPCWTRTLGEPPTGWSFVLSPGHVLAYPSPASGQSNEPEALPLLVVRRDDGRLVQRVLVPAVAKELAVRLTPGGALVATQAGQWSLGDRQAMDAVASPR